MARNRRIPGHSLRYNFSIPLTRRLAGLSYVGHAARLRLLLQRIRRGEAVVVGGLGGSITAGQGVGLSWTRGWLGHLAAWMNAAAPPLAATAARCGGAAAGDTSVRAAAGEAGSREALTGADADGGAAPGRQLLLRPALTRHVVHSGAVPGTQSSYVSACLAQHLPPAPDLVLVEFAVNDPPAPSPAYADPSRRAFERLLRKLLVLPSRPAVVLVNMYAHNAPAPDGSGCCKFWNNAERDFTELAAHYGLPSVSLKAAVWADTAANTSGSEALAAGALFNAGRYHPGPGGHVVAFELLLTLLQELAAADWRMAAAAAAAAAARQHHDGASSTSTSSISSGSGSAEQQQAHDAAAVQAEAELRAAFEAEAARPLPPPLGAENWEPERGSTCIIQQEFHALVVGSGQEPGPGLQQGATAAVATATAATAAAAPAAAPEGWQWTDEGRGKWGFVATEAGRQLRIRVRTELDGPRRDRGDVVAQLVYLRGYDGMGAATLTCEYGCSCGGGGADSADSAEAAAAAAAPWRLVVDGYAGERQVTVAATADFTVSQAADCVLLLTTLGPAPPTGGSQQSDAEVQRRRRFGTPGSKFKVMGILLGEDPAAAAAAGAGGRRGGGGLVDAFLRPESLVSAAVARNATLQAAVGAAEAAGGRR
ncbi:hypothetical protein HXX76_016004 [Chlamydomonas incerta]|uniref:SGNH hydrolase-type esterase domain-containing protein n=1 Tax=Chlamydomonas incerta TaxID=51695 RepID=A0A835SLA0_CHLIN|nr:hypothetical protein HXX76_016004 [Chlamydomonas incerta]|eukprot:KAG2422480.1 hypothetical protein HXX76_016004 [Chlamydomonas incerta]